MSLMEDLVIILLNYTQDNAGLALILIHFSQVPGEYSDREIDDHLAYCADQGLFKKKRVLAGDRALVSMRQKGRDYLNNTVAR